MNSLKWIKYHLRKSGFTPSEKKTVQICKNSQFFDASWYLQRYTDVKQATLDPVWHYIHYGVAEGRDPGPGFSTKEYIIQYPEIKKRKINPLVHYHACAQIGKRKSKNYLQWIKFNDTLKTSHIQGIQNQIVAWQDKPLISLVIPVHNKDIFFLSETIESVVQQLYSNWELFIIDDPSTEKHIKSTIEKYKRDPRIKVIHRISSESICEAHNKALSLMKGRYVGVLNQYDTLSRYALYRVIEALREQPNAKMLYSDEDEIDARGNRSNPQFKTGWNHDLLYNKNYISHLCVYKVSLLKKIGVSRKGYEESPGYDVCLRAIEHIHKENIIHIPYILYHRRYLPAHLSKANTLIRVEAEREALQSHLNRLKVQAQVLENPAMPFYHRIHYTVPTPAPLVSIIIPTKDKAEVLKKCIESVLRKTTYSNFEILIIDNQSIEPATYNYLQIFQQKGIKVLPYDKPFNYSKICNYGAQCAQGDVFLFLNNDTEVISPEWLTEMVGHALRPEVGVVGAKLYYPDGSLQHAGVLCNSGSIDHAYVRVARDDPNRFEKVNLVQNFLAVTGACMAIRRSVFEKLNGFEEEVLAVAFNDIDLCFRAYKAGYRIVWTPYAKLYHYESLTRGSPKTKAEIFQSKREINYMHSKWKDLVYCDPFYNQNLNDFKRNTNFSKVIHVASKFPKTVKKYLKKLR